MKGQIWLWAAGLCWACSKSPAASQAPDKPAAAAEASAHADEPSHEELPKRVRLTPQVLRHAQIQTTKVTREPLNAVLTLPGEISVDPDRSARVASPARGRVLQVRFKEGDAVNRGDVLARVRIFELSKLRADLASASAKANTLRTNTERLATLVEKGLASKQEYLNTKTEADAFLAEAQALREQLTVLGAQGAGSSELLLRAPVSGVVVSRDAVIGQPIDADHALATIADLREVWFLARVFEKDLGRLQSQAKAEVELNAYPREHFSGVVEYVGKQVDPVARTLTARIRLENRADLLRLGLFGVAHVQLPEARPKSPALVVLRTALAEIGGKPVVFVRQPDEDFELHEVVLGEAALGKVEVVSGLREGEEVVTNGVFTLKSVVLKSALMEDE